MTARLLAVALALGSLGAPPPAAAFDQPGCGAGPGKYTDREEWKSSDPASMTCRFLFEGFPISVFGRNTLGGSVRVWITPAGNPEAPLLSCEGVGQCGAEIYGEGQLQQLPGVVPRPAFDCYVAGSGKGTFYCSSGRLAATA